MKNYALIKNEEAYLFVTTADLDNVGGVGQVVTNLMNYIADGKRYKPILLINRWNSKSLQAYGKGPYVKYFYRLRGPYDAKALLKNLILFLFFLPAELKKLHFFLKVNHVGVVNAHYVGLHAISFVILRKLKLFSGKVILSFHGTDAVYLNSIGAIERFFYRMLLRNTDHIVACSRNMADVIERFDSNLSRKITVIHNGIDIQKFNDERDVVFAIDEELQIRPFILNIGAFRQIKGQDVLLRAFSRIADRHPDHCLVMIGAPGDATQPIKKLIDELGLHRRVYLYETIPHEQITAFFNRAELFVLPSRSEGMPIVLFEAAVSSVPVIATAVGGIPEVIEHNVTGLLFETEDIGALAQGLTLLLENPALQKRLGAKLKKHVLENFTWDRAYQKYLWLINTAS